VISRVSTRRARCTVDVSIGARVVGAKFRSVTDYATYTDEEPAWIMKESSALPFYLDVHDYDRFDIHLISLDAMQQALLHDTGIDSLLKLDFVVVPSVLQFSKSHPASFWYDVMKRSKIRIFPFIDVERFMELKQEYMLYLSRLEHQHTPVNWNNKYHQSGFDRACTPVTSESSYSSSDATLQMVLRGTTFGPTAFLDLSRIRSTGIANTVTEALDKLMNQSEAEE
jgi:hypothetical protein